MALDTAKAIETITDDRVRSIFYSSFEISQGDQRLQGMILARAFAKHPDAYAKFKQMSLASDNAMIGQLHHKVASSHAGGANPNDSISEIRKQIAIVESIFDSQTTEDILGEQQMELIVGKMLGRDLQYSKGRRRVVNGEQTTIYKFYLVEHGFLNEKYRGDPIWREFFSDVHNFLQTFNIRNHGGVLAGYPPLSIGEYFTAYNQHIKSGRYTNKNCKEIDYPSLPLFG